MEKTVSIRRNLDIQKKVKEDVSGLQDHDREISTDAEILYRYKLMGRRDPWSRRAHPRADKTFSDTLAPQMTTATLFPR